MAGKIVRFLRNDALVCGGTGAWDIEVDGTRQGLLYKDSCENKLWCLDSYEQEGGPPLHHNQRCHLGYRRARDFATEHFGESLKLTPATYTDGVVFVVSIDNLERRRLKVRGFVKVRGAGLDLPPGTYVGKPGAYERLRRSAADYPVEYFTDFRGKRGFHRFEKEA